VEYLIVQIKGYFIGRILHGGDIVTLYTMEMISDQYGRRFRVLRVSVGSRCNFGCVYCVAGEEVVRAERGLGVQALDAPALLEVIRRLHGRLELETVRLTGGEPLLYPGLDLLVKGLRSMGIHRIGMTTNGSLLERKARALKDAGLEPSAIQYLNAHATSGNARSASGAGLQTTLRIGVLHHPIKKPTWLSPLRGSTTSVYSLTGLPATAGSPFI